MTDPEKIRVLLAAMDKIRALTFDECWDEHRFDFEKCRKNEPRDWAKVQAIAAKAKRDTEER